MARRNPITRGGARAPTWGSLVVLLCLALVTLGGAPSASAAKSRRCKKGTVQVKVGGKPACVSKKFVLPPPSKENALVAGAQEALVYSQLSFKTHSGKRVKSFKQQFGHSWAIAQAKLEHGLTAVIASAQSSAQRPLGDFALDSASPQQSCAAADVADDYGSDPGGNQVKASSTFSSDGVDVTMNLGAEGASIGIKATVKGDTYSMKYDSGEFSCLAYKLPPCPDGDGTLNAYGLKGKTGFSLTVTRGGKVLKSQKYSKKITVETKGQVADDAKLDTVDVKYGETTNVEVDGVRLTEYGNRSVRINMRTKQYDPAESTSFGSANVGGQYANTAGQEADAKGFSSFVSEAISAYSDREKAWQSPNACAKLKLEPKSGTLTLGPGDKGSISTEVDAVADGARATKAHWTLSAQQNGTFSPADSKDREPSISYEVSGSPSGETLSVVVKATSTAGVAQETWSQKLTAIKTISGTFSGQEGDTSDIDYEWSGTATFTRSFSEGGSSVFSLTSGVATVNVSGTGPDGCTHSGTEEILLAPQGFVTVSGASKPIQYQIIAPWTNTVLGPGVEISCPENNDYTESEIPAATAIQSGEAFGTLKTTPDGVTFDGSAGETDSVVGTASWNWSLKGSP